MLAKDRWDAAVKRFRQVIESAPWESNARAALISLGHVRTDHAVRALSTVLWNREIGHALAEVWSAHRFGLEDARHLTTLRQLVDPILKKAGAL